LTLTAKVRSYSSSVISSIGLLTCVVPALLTKMSSRPNAASTSLTAASIAALLATSQDSARALLPMLSAAALALSKSMSAIATRAPSRA